MTTSKKTTRDPVQLDARDPDGQVVFTSEDEDRFVRSCRWVFEAAEQRLSRDVWRHELHALINHVREWVAKHEGQVSACYASPRDNQFAILVAGASETYDFDLADALTELDLQLSEKYRVCSCDVLQIPKGSSKFRDSKGTLIIYGKPPGT